MRRDTQRLLEILVLVSFCLFTGPAVQLLGVSEPDDLHVLFAAGFQPANDDRCAILPSETWGFVTNGGMCYLVACGVSRFVEIHKRSSYTFCHDSTPFP